MTWPDTGVDGLILFFFLEIENRRLVGWVHSNVTVTQIRVSTFLTMIHKNASY